MLASGDFEMMRPAVSHVRGRHAAGPDPQQDLLQPRRLLLSRDVTFYGTYRQRHDRLESLEERQARGHPVANTSIRYHFNNTLELLAMMLDYYAYTEDKEFLQKESAADGRRVSDLVGQALARDAAGKMKMSPSNALETYR